jgi:hypothetical protein
VLGLAFGERGGMREDRQCSSQQGVLLLKEASPPSPCRERPLLLARAHPRLTTARTPCRFIATPHPSTRFFTQNNRSCLTHTTLPSHHLAPCRYITLGSPHAPPPPGVKGVVDQTRGILNWTNDAAPGAYHPEVRADSCSWVDHRAQSAGMCVLCVLRGQGCVYQLQTSRQGASPLSRTTARGGTHGLLVCTAVPVMCLCRHVCLLCVCPQVKYVTIAGTFIKGVKPTDEGTLLQKFAGAGYQQVGRGVSHKTLGVPNLAGLVDCQAAKRQERVCRQRSVGFLCIPVACVSC